VHETARTAAEAQAHLPRGLDEGKRFDVADRAADLDDRDVGLAIPSGTRAAFDEIWISLVTCGMTCTVLPRYSPRRSFLITDS